MKVAIVQLQSSNDLRRNLAKMKSYVEQAKKENADIVIFPEMAYFTGKQSEWIPLLSQFELLSEEFQGWAKQYGITLIPGTLREPVEGDATRCFNTLLFIDATGKQIAKYRKIFLFKATLPHKTYDESSYCTSGSEIVVYREKETVFGFSICFDVRFPELFRGLKKSGAQVVFMPSAFTVPTGRAHWEILVRARAIENGFFVIAPDLVGRGGDGNETYGHSLVVSPWGEVLAEIKEGEGMRICSLDLSAISQAVAKVDPLSSLRPDIFKGIF